MELKQLKKQKGLLSIISISIILLASIVSVLLLSMLTSSIKSTENIVESKAAFYLAVSSSQIIKKAIAEKIKTCVEINNEDKQILNNNIIRGEYIARCYINKIQNRLETTIPKDSSQNIKLHLNTDYTLTKELSTNDETYIFANNTRSFSPNGIIKVEDEYIAYKTNNTNKNILTILARGINGTKITSHKAGKKVSQNPLNSSFVIIGNEAIGYTGSKTTGEQIELKNIQRGILDTTKNEHNKNDKVIQSELIISIESGVPDLKNPVGKRNIEEIIYPDIKNLSSIENSFVFGNQQYPAIVSGKTIKTDKNVKIKYPANAIEKTEKANNLFASIFSYNLNEIKKYSYNENNLNNILTDPNNDNKIIKSNGMSFKNKTIIPTSTNTSHIKALMIEGNLEIYSGNSNKSTNIDITIGSEKNPIILIINGDLKITGKNKAKLNIYGLVYVTGEFIVEASAGSSNDDDDDDRRRQIKSTQDDDNNKNKKKKEQEKTSTEKAINIQGFIAVQGKVDITGKTTIELRPGLIGKLRAESYLIPDNFKLYYKSKEIFE